MDPNECIRLLRIAQRELDIETELEMYRNLDGWISNGGFLPKEWNK
jgi:hypothetical protein